MKCANCNKGINEVGVMHRTAPLGDENANWTCESCLNDTEPELLKNIQEDSDFMELLNVLKPN